MGASVKYLKREPGSGRLSYRRDFPAPLRFFVPGSPREFKRSLGCTDIGDSLCAERFKAAGKDYDRLVALARKAMSRTFDTLDSPTTALLVERYRVSLLQADQDRRYGLTIETRARADRIESNDLCLDTLRDQFLETKDQALFIRLYGDQATELAAAEGLHVDGGSPEFRRLCVMLQEADFRVAQLIVDRDNGALVPTPEVSAPFVSGSAVASPRSQGRTLDTLIAAFISDRQDQRKWSVAAAGSYDPVFRLLRGVLRADRHLSTIGRDDGRQVLKALQSLPANLGKLKSLKGLSVLDAIEKGKKLGLRTIAPKTINDAYLSQASSVFFWAVKEQWMIVNPISGFSVPDPVADADKRDPFTMDQINKLFATAPWKHRDVTGGKRPVRFWGALLGLFHGMRRGEMMQLKVADIEMKDGVALIQIRGERLKTANARRTIPLHPELQRMGFLAFVASQRTAGATLLFPGNGPNPRNQWGDGYSKWFQRLLKPLGFDGTKLGFHSFRHNFQDGLREAGLHGTAIAQELAGRAKGGDVSSRYGSGFSTARLAEAIGKIRYPELSLEHLYAKD